MGYIKFVLSERETDDTGLAKRTVISRFESDMANTSTLETNLIWHALALRGKVEMFRSCFGAGWWINDKPWINEEGWKNN